MPAPKTAPAQRRHPTSVHHDAHVCRALHGTRGLVAWLSLELVLACGGEVVPPTTGDAGTAAPDATTEDDGDGWCGLPHSQHSFTNDDCAWSNTWSAGGTQYGVSCSCPVGVCTCATDDGTTPTQATVKAPAICPPCYLCGDYTGATLSNVCGFPSP